MASAVHSLARRRSLSLLTRCGEYYLHHEAPRWSSYASTGVRHAPTPARTVASFPNLPNLPNLPKLPSLPKLPKLPSLPSPATLRTALAHHLASLYARFHRPFLALSTLTLTTLTFSTSAHLLTLTASTAAHATTLAATLAASVPLLAVVLYRRYLTINPTSVYRTTMLRLNGHPGVLEVLGAPVVSASDCVRACVVRDGGLCYVEEEEHDSENKTKKKGLLPLEMRCGRVEMVWVVEGGRRDGIVSVAVGKARGRLVTDVLALDVLPARGSISTMTTGEKEREREPERERERERERDFDRVYVEGGALSTRNQGGTLDGLRALLLRHS